MAMYRKPIVPEDFQVPDKLKLDICDLLPLTIGHARLDYEAVMDNYDENGKPLSPKHTLKQNTIDLGYHQKEFQKRCAFTYTVLTKDHTECLGCLYMYPCDDSIFDVEIDFWLRDKYKNEEDDVFQKIKIWIKKTWPFKNVKYVYGE